MEDSVLQSFRDSGHLRGLHLQCVALVIDVQPERERERVGWGSYGRLLETRNGVVRLPHGHP